MLNNETYYIDYPQIIFEETVFKENLFGTALKSLGMSYIIYAADYTKLVIRKCEFYENLGYGSSFIPVDPNNSPWARFEA